MRTKFREYFIPTIFYSLYIFAFILTEFNINVRAEELYGQSAANIYYSLGMFCTGAGYLLFSLSCKSSLFKRRGKSLMLVSGLIFIISVFLFESLDVKAVLAVFAPAALISFGYVGGCVHYLLSLVMRDSAFLGRTVGIAAAAATVMQFVVQNFLISAPAYIIGVILSVLVLIFISIMPHKARILENPLRRPENPKRAAVVGKTLIVAVALMSLIVSFNDSVVTSLHADGTINIASYVRLSYAVGLLGAGFIADIKKREYLPLATVCAMSVSTVAVMFLDNPALYYINAILLYFYCGFYSVFLTVTFLDLAPRTDKPALWSGMGKITRSFTGAVAIMPSIMIFDYFGVLPAVVISSVITVLLLILISLNGLMVRPKNAALAPATSREHSLSDEEKHAAFVEKFHLTPREDDVLSELLLGNESTQVISEKLYISRRMVERYFSQIYEKTDTKNRIALIMLYHNECK